MGKFRAPPVVVWMVALVMMWGGDHLFPSLGFKGVIPLPIIAVPSFIALFLAFHAIFSFLKAKTSVDPHHPEKASRLVTTGPYRFTRNPMYLGLILLLLTYGLYLGNPTGVSGMVFFWWYIGTFQIPAEEEVLLKKFGGDYSNFKARVRRWL